jgi:hypothetical protein
LDKRIIQAAVGYSGMAAETAFRGGDAHDDVASFVRNLGFQLVKKAEAGIQIASGIPAGHVFDLDADPETVVEGEKRIPKETAKAGSPIVPGHKVLVDSQPDIKYSFRKFFGAKWIGE